MSENKYTIGESLVEALKQISIALKNISWDAVCASGSGGSENTIIANKAIEKLDTILSTLPEVREEKVSELKGAEELAKLRDEYAFQVPYDGSEEFYNKERLAEFDRVVKHLGIAFPFSLSVSQKEVEEMALAKAVKFKNIALQELKDGNTPKGITESDISFEAHGLYLGYREAMTEALSFAPKEISDEEIAKVYKEFLISCSSGSTDNIADGVWYNEAASGFAKWYRDKLKP